MIERATSPWKRNAGILLLDAASVSVAFYLGYLLRFEGHIPQPWRSQFVHYLPFLLAVRLPLHLAFGIHRWAFRLSGFHEALRLVLTALTGTGCFVAVCYFMQRAAEDVSLGPPRSVIAIEFFLTLSFLGAFRFSPRLAHTWSLGRSRSRSGSEVRAVIVGAGSAGELLLRDLNRSDEHSYDVVGFVDDDSAKWHTSIGGRPVLGPADALPDVVRRREVHELLFAIPRLPAARLREILALCADLKLGYKILPVSFAYLNDRVSASMLQELQPDDLLLRRQVSFDEGEIRALIRGRRLLVTGAAGSIGSEICRQAAACGPASLVLADMNENELYFLYRHLKERHPDVEVFAEVADVRDRVRIEHLGREHRPQDVFHAAAHKHVPLMEGVPEEAAKTNVAGCLNVARMAEAVGAERFVLVSTDKAVNPSSVMGATKAVAELIVRHLGRRSKVAFTAVRFGNVLGSAGSVVPLFKAQIARGGPVTVTDPECRRYLMTIREAVGLVFLAGLGRHGDLCILEMGEPIRILDLARLMITMSGQVPEDEIPIVITGLRPGEKLDEELMTGQEERSSHKRGEMIRVITTPPPSPDLMEQVTHLLALAQEGDREGVRAALRAIVPTYDAVPRTRTEPAVVPR
jgi:FlaA1/EpsC-like NDP-sugar epimerase